MWFRPLLDTHFAQLAHSAALLGSGSEVLGFDTPISTDHNWGPRLLLFLSPQDKIDHGRELDKRLRSELPYTFRGYPVNFSAPDMSDGGTRWMDAVTSGPVNHRVEVLTLHEFFDAYLGIEPFAQLGSIDWLTLPEQKLLEVTAGRVFYDGLGLLEPARTRLSYFPQDVWLYKLAAQWRRIGQEEAFMGRCGAMGDELGSRLVAARQVRDLMKLAFLIERRYTPYTKWLGAAFTRLRLRSTLGVAA